MNILMRISYRSFPLFLTVFTVIFAHSATAKDALKITSSVAPLHHLVEAITSGTETRNTLLVDDGGAPHEHHLKPSNMRNIASADIIFTISPAFERNITSAIKDIAGANVKHLMMIEQDGIKTLPLRHFFDDSKKTTTSIEPDTHTHDEKPNEPAKVSETTAPVSETKEEAEKLDAAFKTIAQITNAERTILTMEAVEDEEHEHNKTTPFDNTDPHIWLNISNAIHMAEIIRDTLSAHPKTTASTKKKFHTNTAALSKKLNNLDAMLRNSFDQVKDQAYVTGHDAFQYLEESYGLQKPMPLSPGHNKSATPSFRLALEKQFKETPANCYLTSHASARRNLPSFLRRAEIRVITVDSLGSPIVLNKMEAYRTTMWQLGTAFYGCMKNSTKNPE